MIALLVYYIALPLVAFSLVLRFIRRWGADPVPVAVRAACAADPIERRWYRAVAVEGALGSGGERVAKLGDFERQEDAVDAAYADRQTRAAGERSWLVLDDRGDILRQLS